MLSSIGGLAYVNGANKEDNSPALISINKLCSTGGDRCGNGALIVKPVHTHTHTQE